MENILVPTSVGPSKLDLYLSYCSELNDESKEKVILLIDINRLGTLLSGKPMPPKAFYSAYDQPLEILELTQHAMQTQWNTIQYRSTIQGADF